MPAGTPARSLVKRTQARPILVHLSLRAAAGVARGADGLEQLGGEHEKDERAARQHRSAGKRPPTQNTNCLSPEPRGTSSVASWIYYVTVHSACSRCDGGLRIG